jgi:hypothetical protein
MPIERRRPQAGLSDLRLLISNQQSAVSSQQSAVSSQQSAVKIVSPLSRLQLTADCNFL